MEGKPIESLALHAAAVVLVAACDFPGDPVAADASWHAEALAPAHSSVFIPSAFMIR